MFGPILAFVDRDVSANWKPVSLIGMAIPFLPFIVFNDGKPAERYPILSAVALTLSLGWGALLLWRTLKQAWAELQGSGNAFGTLRPWTLIARTLALVVMITAVSIFLGSEFA